MCIFTYDIRKVYKIFLTIYESNSVLEVVHEENLKLEIHAGGVQLEHPSSDYLTSLFNLFSNQG